MAIHDGEQRSKGVRVLGYAFFTDPQVGRAGLTLDQAREKDYNALAVTLQLEQSVHIHPALAEGLPTLARRFFTTEWRVRRAG